MLGSAPGPHASNPHGVLGAAPALTPSMPRIAPPPPRAPRSSGSGKALAIGGAALGVAAVLVLVIGLASRKHDESTPPDEA